MAQEKSLLQIMKEMVTDYKAIYLIWKNAPYFLNKECNTFDELKANYKNFPDIEEDQTRKWDLEEPMQKASKYLMQRLHHQKMQVLYEKYYELALGGDVQSFKAFNEFSKEFFKDANTNELDEILDNLDID